MGIERISKWGPLAGAAAIGYILGVFTSPLWRLIL